MGKTLDKKIYPSRKEAKRFLIEKVAKVYNSASYKGGEGGYVGLQRFKKDYNGPFKDYLTKVMRYIGKRDRKGPRIRILIMGYSEIENILNNTFLKRS